MRRDLGRTDGLADVLAIGVHLRIVRIDADVEMAVGEEFADGFGDELLIDGFGIQIDAFVHAPQAQARYIAPVSRYAKP